MHFARNGGWLFPFDPKLSAADAPALWAPEQAPMIVPLIPAPVALSGLLLFGAVDGPAILADRRIGHDRHQVIALRGRRHRLWFPGGAEQTGPFVIALPSGQDATVRSEAADQLIRAVQGLPARSEPLFRLTFNQHHRLKLWLAVLDARDAGQSAREITHGVVYRNLEDLRGPAWTGSSERRQTYRLIDEAQAVREGRYRALLRGEFPKL